MAALSLVDMTYCRCQSFIRHFKAGFQLTQRYSTVIPAQPRKKRGRDIEDPKYFVDFRRIRVVGGNGGNGMVHLASLPNKEWAGPDGGNGGHGGHVIFQADPEVTNLGDLKPVIRGQRGENGRTQNKTGKSAKHNYVKVPVNTIFKTEDGDVLVCLDEPDDYYVGAHGGAGGRGNSFYLSNENRAPIIGEEGAQGEERLLHLEMRVMAHAGLIGFPNAGKSTLLRALSRARPKVAAYPFTTLNPHIGMVQFSDHEQIAVADIPGLVKGSHENKGLGFSFLRHVERCLCLLYVVDMTEEEPWQQLADLKEELEHFSPGLSQRPHALVGNKMDLLEAQNNLEIFQKKVDIPIIPISAMNKTGIEALQSHLRELYDKHNLQLDL